MKLITRLFSVSLILLISTLVYSQSDIGFSYQAVARTADGYPLVKTEISVRFSIHLENLEGALIWQEEQDVQTSNLGLFSTVIGGEKAYNQSGKVDSFEEINWSEGPYFLQVWLKRDKEFMDMGGATIQTVPLARHADMAKHSAGNFSVTGEPGNPEAALFEVKRADGMPVFAVYDDGVWVYADPDSPKGVKGGFAVGGYSRSKGVVEEYMRISPDSARIYINQDPVKGIKGGFAVGGYSRSAKGPGDGFLEVTPASTHVFFDEDAASKGVKGGFAVGGYSRSKTASNQLMSLTPLNYFIGHEAGFSITDGGIYNQFFGYEAGKSTTTADYNIFLGYQAGMNNTTGGSNILLGYKAGHNFNGTDNVVIGNSACENSQMYNSVVIGKEAAKEASGNGWGNVFVGFKTGYNNKKSGGTGISGGRNVFIGRESGEENDLGGANVYLGSFAGNKQLNSYRNVFVGDGAGSVGNEGSNNVYMGERAGYTNRGNGNIVIGREAGSSETNYTLDSDYDYNVMVGYRSGFKNKTGEGNVFLGKYAGYNELESDKLYIDNSSTSSPLIWGDFSENKVQINGTLEAVSFNILSDVKLKKEINTLEDALDKVMNLRGVTYKWDLDNPDVAGQTESEQIGVIAQEVEALYPELIKETQNGYKSVAYGNLSAVLIEAIKEQQSMIDQQQQVIEELTQRMELLEGK